MRTRVLYGVDTGSSKASSNKADASAMIGSAESEKDVRVFMGGRYIGEGGGGGRGKEVGFEISIFWLNES